MFFSSATADYNMGERAKKGSPTSTLHDRHCCGILSWTALEIEPYEVSCLSVILTRHQPEAIRKTVHVSIERNTILCVRFFFYIKISQIRRGNEKVSFFLPSSLHYSPSTSENLLMRSNFLFHVKWMLSTRWHNSSEMVVPIFVDYQ